MEEAEKLQQFCTFLEDRLESYIERYEASFCKTSDFAYELQAWARGIKDAQPEAVVEELDPEPEAA